MNIIFKSGLSLLIFMVISIFFVGLTHQKTEQKIAQNITEVLLKRLHELAPNYDNDLIKERISQRVFLHGVTQTIDIYPAKHSGKTISYLIKHLYPGGYSGNIMFISAISPSMTLLGARVITHQETPGLGDAIELKKSPWMLSLNDTSLKKPEEKFWGVKRDGKYFDQLTGATITSKAVIDAHYELLKYLGQYKNLLSASP